MRTTLFVCLLAMLGEGVHAQEPSLRDLVWLTGDWQMTSSNRVVEEHWTAPTANALIGMSRTVRDDRTVAFEFIRIERRDSGVFYVAQPSGRPPTDFKLTSSRDGQLVFEGDGHDRVRRITYRRDGEELNAVVEGDENGRTFKLEYRYQRSRQVERPAIR
jgi:hypothetical protein